MDSKKSRSGRKKTAMGALVTVKASLVSPAISAGMWFDSRLRHNALRTFPLRSHIIVASQ